MTANSFLFPPSCHVMSRRLLIHVIKERVFLYGDAMPFNQVIHVIILSRGMKPFQIRLFTTVPTNLAFV